MLPLPSLTAPTPATRAAEVAVAELMRNPIPPVNAPTAPFTANGRQYPAGSFVIKTAQPYGAFANTMLAKQDYPDLRLFPGGPPEPPYDVTGHTLWMLTGVNVDSVAKPFDAQLELVKKVAPMTTTVAAKPKGAQAVGERAGDGVLETEEEPCRQKLDQGEVRHSLVPVGQWVVPRQADAEHRRLVEQVEVELDTAEAHRRRAQRRLGKPDARPAGDRFGRNAKHFLGD